MSSGEDFVSSTFDEDGEYLQRRPATVPGATTSTFPAPTFDVGDGGGKVVPTSIVRQQSLSNVPTHVTKVSIYSKKQFPRVLATLRKYYSCADLSSVDKRIVQKRKGNSSSRMSFTPKGKRTAGAASALSPLACSTLSRSGAIDSTSPAAAFLSRSASRSSVLSNRTQSRSRSPNTNTNTAAQHSSRTHPHPQRQGLMRLSDDSPRGSETSSCSLAVLRRVRNRHKRVQKTQLSKKQARNFRLLNPDFGRKSGSVGGRLGLGRPHTSPSPVVGGGGSVTSGIDESRSPHSSPLRVLVHDCVGQHHSSRSYNRNKGRCRRRGGRSQLINSAPQRRRRATTTRRRKRGGRKKKRQNNNSNRRSHHYQEKTSSMITTTTRKQKLLLKKRRVERARVLGLLGGCRISDPGEIGVGLGSSSSTMIHQRQNEVSNSTVGTDDVDEGRNEEEQGDEGRETTDDDLSPSHQVIEFPPQQQPSRIRQQVKVVDVGSDIPPLERPKSSLSSCLASSSSNDSSMTPLSSLRPASAPPPRENTNKSKESLSKISLRLSRKAKGSVRSRKKSASAVQAALTSLETSLEAELRETLKFDAKMKKLKDDSLMQNLALSASRRRIWMLKREVSKCRKSMLMSHYRQKTQTSHRRYLREVARLKRDKLYIRRQNEKLRRIVITMQREKRKRRNGGCGGGGRQSLSPWSVTEPHSYVPRVPISRPVVDEDFPPSPQAHSSDGDAPVLYRSELRPHVPQDKSIAAGQYFIPSFSVKRRPGFVSIFDKKRSARWCPVWKKSHVTGGTAPFGSYPRNTTTTTTTAAALSSDHPQSSPSPKSQIVGGPMPTNPSSTTQSDSPSSSSGWETAVQMPSARAVSMMNRNRFGRARKPRSAPSSSHCMLSNRRKKALNMRSKMSRSGHPHPASASAASSSSSDWSDHRERKLFFRHFATSDEEEEDEGGPSPRASLLSLKTLADDIVDLESERDCVRERK